MSEPLAIRTQITPTFQQNQPDVTDYVSAFILRWTNGTIERMVVADLDARNVVGIEKYDTPLQPHNARDAELDLYQELCDAVKYAAQRVMEVQGDMRHSIVPRIVVMLVEVRTILWERYGE